MNAGDAPASAADPRPGNRPYYIAPACPNCGAHLVLHDSLTHPERPTDQVWYDEWECPECRDGLYLDWPRDAYEHLP